MKRTLTLALFLLAAGFLSSCKSYKYHIMFKLEDEQDLSWLSSEVSIAEKQYLIQPNDVLDIRVYTNKGERIIDPNYELQKDINQNSQQQNRPTFQVFENGTIKFPMIDTVKIVGLSLRDAELYLEKKYSTFYKDAFVTLEYLNKRVVVLGSPGGMVIPLESENMSIIEVIALAGGIDKEGKAQNLRLIRGYLHSPEVFLINLSTIEGMRTSMTSAQPGDIIYIEPKVKLFSEFASDYMTVFSILISTATLVALIISIDNE